MSRSQQSASPRLTFPCRARDNEHSVKKMNTRSRTFKSRRRDANAVALIEAAEGAIARKGYDRVTMRDIAAEAGCAPGTLYLYFQNKRDVVKALMVRHSGLLLPLLAEAAGSTADPVERLRLITQKSVEYFSRNRSVARAIFAAKPGKPDEFMASLPPTMRKGWQEIRQAELEAIREGQGQGKIRRDFPSESIWKFMHGVFMGFLEELDSYEPAPSEEEQMQVLWGLLTGGISGAERRHAES